MSRPAAWLTLAWFSCLGACGEAQRAPSRRPETRAMPPSAATGPVAPAPPRPEVPEAPPSIPSAAACAEVHIGLDLRALPRGTSPGGIDLFVRGQAFDLAGKARAGAPPEIRTTPGAGLFDAVFRGEREADEVARCEQTVTAYLAAAPRLPILMEPAARVIAGCRHCAPALRRAE